MPTRAEDRSDVGNEGKLESKHNYVDVKDSPPPEPSLAPKGVVKKVKERSEVKR